MGDGQENMPAAGNDSLGVTGSSVHLLQFESGRNDTNGACDGQRLGHNGVGTHGQVVPACTPKQSSN